MGLSAFYGAPTPETNAVALLRHAINAGVTFLDTSDIYGPETNELLLGKALKDGLRDKVELATKFGITASEDGKFGFRGDPEYVSACEASLRRLGVTSIDLYYQHRINTTLPIEITVWLLAFNLFQCIGELKKLVEEGKINYIGLSEASASTIRRAHAVHPITAVQIEWSLWSRDVEEDIIPTCRCEESKLAISFFVNMKKKSLFASGPKLVENLEQDDYRKARAYFKIWSHLMLLDITLSQGLPRFQQENLDNNKILYEKVQEMATKKSCTPAQLALAWVHHQGDDVCPIPGTSKIQNLNQNIGALSVKLTPEEMVELEAIARPDFVKGERYDNNMVTYKDSETPPLSSWKEK
ncbi:predicted protein [Arabidopsis lyrata subsp. lyrata]|uniref:Predicted protein n=1 Tax=Arabidopsis lyrata subsp. lyrata TaxID=81972 RepID=D7KWQ5_ARALL|nr:predicted protein [Arabidopsis lyrata subsp. lyrata]